MANNDIIGIYSQVISDFVLFANSTNISIGNSGGTNNARLDVVGINSTNTDYTAWFRNSTNIVAMSIRNDSVIFMPNLPTSSAGLPGGALWNNSGVINVI
jgi:hypothetical protein